jgi:hypothetical protein
VVDRTRPVYILAQPRASEGDDEPSASLVVCLRDGRHRTDEGERDDIIDLIPLLLAPLLFREFLPAEAAGGRGRDQQQHPDFDVNPREGVTGTRSKADDMVPS